MKTTLNLEKFLDEYALAKRGDSHGDKVKENRLRTVFGAYMSNLADGVEEPNPDWKAMFLVLETFPNLLELNGLSVLKIMKPLAVSEQHDKRIVHVLKSEAMKLFLLHESKDKEVQQAFSELMAKFVKTSYFAAYHGYDVFINWLPEWDEQYPMVIEAVAEVLEKLKSSGRISLNVLKEKNLYDIYCYQGQ